MRTSGDGTHTNAGPGRAVLSDAARCPGPWVPATGAALTEKSRGIPKNNEISRKIPKNPGKKSALPGSVSETRASIR